ncbi:hypothetical protein J1C52_11765 [Roseibaca sp. Y0-43]|nr:hypothetical protein [Roseibaca sp. Y0-43]
MTALTLAASLMASTGQAYVSGGHEYGLTCNPDGYVLTSRYPVARTKGFGAATQVVSGIEKLYLGKSCDAFHPIFGGGRWCWANGGFVAEFAEFRFGFARQELHCEAEPGLGLECLC